VVELPKRCVPCEGGIPALSEAQARERHAHVPSWTLEGQRLRRSFRLKDFRKALAWVNRVGMLAEEEGHHPDFHLTGWNQVELVLWTHAVGGLSDNDFVLAKRIDELAQRDGLG
jgi:4a-hydroxytetrahydrobiopterin dehydratase